MRWFPVAFSAKGVFFCDMQCKNSQPLRYESARSATTPRQLSDQHSYLLYMPNSAIHRCDNRYFRIEWNDFYDLDEYKVDDTLPMVRDPALPSHNVAESAMEDWTQFREEITVWSASLCP